MNDHRTTGFVEERRLLFVALAGTSVLLVGVQGSYERTLGPDWERRS